MRAKLEKKIERFNKFQGVIYENENQDTKKKEVDIRAYAKYLLKEGSIIEKRELLGNLKSKMSYKEKTLTLLAN